MTIKMEYDPKTRPATASTQRRYVGNHQVIALANVLESVDVIGNHNSVTVGVNRAAIKVVGNACTVRVHGGDGRIQVVGNNGTVWIADGVDASRVVCVGNKSRVVRFDDGGERATQRGSSADSPEREAAHDDVGHNYLEDKNRTQSMSAAPTRAEEPEVRRARRGARFEERQGFLYIDNCVSVKAGRTRCVRF